jgi:phosphoadenosine phosphosulfate reductase
MTAISAIDAAPSRDASPAPAIAGPELARLLNERLAHNETLDERLRAVSEAIPGRVTFSTSLGLEDQAVLHGVARAGVPIDVFTLDTGRHFPETLQVLQDSENVYDIKIRVMFPDAREVEDLVARDGIFGFRDSVENRKTCCDIRKVRPLNRALTGAKGWITGIRREQSAGRAEVAFAAWDAQHALIKVNPIADWSLEQLKAYIADNAIPVNELHAKGFPSIGCQPCTRAIRPGEDIRAGRWWWEAKENGQECGLHNKPANNNQQAAISAAATVAPRQ